MRCMINEVIAERIASARLFLKNRNISYDKIEKAFGCDVHDSKYLLLTSSAVHGLANDGSDIDFISINHKAFPPDRVAAQHFIEKNHMEIKPIWEDDINQALRFLRSLENKPYLDVAHVLKNWEHHFKISKKYLERTVNGVDINGSCPYMDYTPSLAYVWLTRSFEMFRKCVIYVMLSEASGEKIARLSYGMNALLYVMDTVLSFHGYVYSNKKWYLQRYTKFVNEKKYSTEFQELISQIIELYDLVLSIPNKNTQVRFPIYDLYAHAKKLMNITIEEGKIIESESMLHSLPFLPGSIVVYREKDQRSILMNASKILEFDLSLVSLLALDQTDAEQLLTLLRTGMLRLS